MRTWASGKTAAVLWGAAGAGVCAYAFQVVGARMLGDEAYAPIGILWTIQYLIFAIFLSGVEAYVTRDVLASPSGTMSGPASRRLALTVLGLAIVLGAAALAWREALFMSRSVQFPAVVASMLVVYALFVYARGSLAGIGKFGSYGAMTFAEAGTKLVGASIVALAMPTTKALAWMLPAGPVGALTVWVWLRRRSRVDRPAASNAVSTSSVQGSSLFGYMRSTVVANVAAQVLLAGAPLMLIPLGASSSEISLVFIVLTASRVPIVFAFGGLLTRALPHIAMLTDARQGRQLATLTQRIGFVACGGALVVGPLAGVFGPALFAGLFGADFRPSRVLAGGTAAAIALATGALGLNQVLIGMKGERRMVWPWVVALCLGVATVLVWGGNSITRVVRGLMIGEFCAVSLLSFSTIRCAKGVMSRPGKVDDRNVDLP